MWQKVVQELAENRLGPPCGRHRGQEGGPLPFDRINVYKAFSS